MKKPKRLLTALVLLALGAACGVLPLLWPRGPAHQIDPEGFGRIREGMTEPEVTAVLHAAEGSHASRAVVPLSTRPSFTPPGPPPPTRRDYPKAWTGDRWCIEVWFDAQGLVIDRALYLVIPLQPTAFDRLRMWLGLWP